MAAVTAFNLTTNNMSIGHYEAYGNALATAYAGNPYGYRGYYTDSETGFSYLNARYYDPATQRFTQEDTYWGDNLQRNLYAYCSGNPVMYTDPSGHSVTIAAAVGALAMTAFTVEFALSIGMYLYAMTGSHFLSNRDFSAWNDPIGSIMRNRLSNSKSLRTNIDKYISTLKRLFSNKTYRKGFTYSYTKNESIDFKDRDLAYSVGKANCKLTITTDFSRHWLTRKTRYAVTVVLNDVYDFHNLTPNTAGFITRIVNNYFGYWPQGKGVLKPYKWTITHNFEYYQ